MKNEGKKFEEDFFKSLNNDYFKYRLRDAGGWNRGEDTRFTIKNLCDLIYFDGEILNLLELKSTKSKSVPISMIDKPVLKEFKDNKGNILSKIIFYPKIEAMAKELEKTKTWSGYIINFREHEETYQIKSLDLLNHFKASGKKSINIHDCKMIGVLIPQKKKISRYIYEF